MTGLECEMVSAIIPARNEEASIARAVESVAAQAEVGEVIVVDDWSTDRTAAILEELSARVPKLRVVAAEPLPPGWTGKNHAVAIGAREAEGEWLLFTDADTDHGLGSARRALNDAVEHDAVMVSYSPEQELGSFWERALIPFVYCRLGARFSFARVNDPAKPDAAANGQFLLVLADAYAAVGGHGGVAGQVLEDVALARRLKQAGHRIYFTAPVGLVRTRMYRSFGAMWEGWTKNLYPLMGGSARSMLLELAEVAPWFEALALISIAVYASRRHGPSLWLVVLLAIAALAGRSARYGSELYRNLFPVSLIQYYVPAVCMYTAALVASWWRNTHGTVVWKGREYATGRHGGQR